MMKSAFLDGVKWGNAKDANPKFSADRAKRTLSRAEMLGLGSTNELVIDELDNAKRTVLSFAKEQQRALPPITPNRRRGRRPVLLIEEDENDDSGYEDVDVDMLACENDEDVDDDVEMIDDGETAYDDDSDGCVYELRVGGHNPGWKPDGVKVKLEMLRCLKR
jgi:hypothetical protein